ncbi:MAG: translocation/assembly module TamB domain-containing protein [Syntrophorhabdaceae bacterium]|nr:translocation/assembly module TamB domain-containing protein [Syntrophorhabdaceae bacterium]
MSKRFVLWFGSAFLLAFFIWSGWRLSITVSEKLRGVEAELSAYAANYGLDVRHGGLKLHLFRLCLSLDEIEARDALADRFLASANNIEISLSLLRVLRGEVPVSRIRARNFRIEAGEWNRALYEKLCSIEESGDVRLPEFLFVDGLVSLGPFGPVQRMDANVREVRVRQGRFLGTRIHVAVSRVDGLISIPGEGVTGWPFPSMEADMVFKGNAVRVRKFTAQGDASTISFSGLAEMKKRLIDGKASGTIDLANWIEAGYPGASYARNAFRSGKAEFSVSASGPLENPSGRAKLYLKKSDLRGVAVSDLEAALSSSGSMVRFDRVRAKLLGGSFDASGSYDLNSFGMELKAALNRISLASIPWSDIEAPGRFSGKANIEASVSGTPDRLKATASLSMPEGVESHPELGGRAYKCRLPVTLVASVEMPEAGKLRLESARLRAGLAEAWAEGEILSSARRLKLRGAVRAPSGKAEEYGFLFPVSWRQMDAEWEVSGPLSMPRMAVSADVNGLAAWSLPPASLTVTVEGVPTGTLRFAAGIPADPFKMKTIGTVSALMDPAKTRADVSVSTHGINLSESGKWFAATLVSLGKDPKPVREYLDGMSGTVEADARIKIAAGMADIKGSIRSARIDVRGVPISAVTATGEYRSAGDARWTARGGGRLGDGAVSFAAEESADGNSKASAGVSGLRISQALSLLRQDGFKGVDGIFEARLDAKRGASEWEIQRLEARSAELSVGDARIANVRVEGTLGAETGMFSARSESPSVSVSGDIRRDMDWRTRFSMTASSLPTSFLFAAAGRPGVASEGVWRAEAEGVALLAGLLSGKPVTPDTFPVFRATVHAESPGMGTLSFKEFRATGARSGGGIAGSLLTTGPETRLAWEVSLREPFEFRLEGPFSIGEESNGRPADDKRRVSVNGKALITGSLKLPERTNGAVRVESFSYREGGWELKGKDFAARMEADGVRLEDVTLTAADAPVRIAGKISWDGDMDARVNGKLPAGLVRLVVPGVFEKLDGIVTAEVRVTGNMFDPVIVGTGRLDEVSLSFKGYAQQFEGLKGEAVLSREKVVFEHFEGRSGGGYVDGWGEVPLQMDAGQRLYFSVDFFDVRYPYPDDFQPVIQGHVELFGPIDDIMVAGDVEVQSARYKKNIYPERAFLDFRRRLADVSARRDSTDFRARLDINVVADRTLRVKNNLANTSGSGEFRVQGDTNKVIVLGSFDMYEGYVELYGNRYEIKRAIIDFQDPRRINPYLDVRAETRKSGYLIAVLVSGTVEKPEVNFSSDPPLGQTDVVSLLSFGVTTQTLLSTGYRSSFENVGTTGAVGGSAIALGSLGGVDERIRGTVGLDKFSIETGFSPTTQTFEPRLVARKSFEDRLSVGMSQSLGTTSETAASLEMQLMERVYLESGWKSGDKSVPGQVSGDVRVRYRFQSLKDLLYGRD